MLGSHRENAHFNRARWRRWVVLPCWAIQILILMSLMGLFSYRLSHTITTWEDEEKKGGLPVVEFVWEIANISFSLICLAITLISIARFIAEVLTPLPLLFGCILNLVLASVVLALDIVIYVRRKDKNYSLIGLGLDIILILFTIIPLIYAIIIYRRLLKYDDYHLPGNHKAFGFANIEEEGGERFPPRRSAPYISPDIANRDSAVLTTTGDEPQWRDRSMSIGSHRISLSFGSNATPSTPSSPLEQRTSYDHKRDTQFDAYVARRLSQDRGRFRDSMPSQGDVKRALGDEFGFTQLLMSADSAKINPNGEIISSGAVHVAHASQPRTSSIGRQASLEAFITCSTRQTGYNSPVGVTTPTGDALQRGQSLNSVPEAREEEDDHGQGRLRENCPSKGKQSFLNDHDLWSRSGGAISSPILMDRSDGFEVVELVAGKQRADL
ncbi:hypothetical protein GGS21DRAFT_170003 [Xylaria nigripes]|nr:hypothetical protein GGS21DRAFT_170003 [Xylaria nigripes]